MRLLFCFVSGGGCEKQTHQIGEEKRASSQADEPRPSAWRQGLENRW